MTTMRGWALTSGLVAALTLMTACVSRPTTTKAGDSGASIEALDGLADVQTWLREPSGRRVLIYHSPRCDFCKGVLHAVQEVQPELAPTARIAIVDIDSNPDVAAAQRIGPVPVVLFLDGPREIKRWRVARPAPLVRRGLRAFFSPEP